MGAVLIVLVIVFLLTRKGKKKKNRTTFYGKSDWERECDDGGKFFNW
jgi:hypothetical protein